MSYIIELTPLAMKHLEQWKKSGQKKILLKIAALFEELQLHPTTGTGQVEQLRGNLAGYWSRRIDKANRIVYRIDEERVIVSVISVRGHY